MQSAVQRSCCIAELRRINVGRFFVKSTSMANVDLLVIGGSGFVGAKVVEAALQAGRNVAYTYASHKIHLPVTSFQVNIQDKHSLEACVAETQPRNIIYCAVPHPGSDKELHEIVSVEGVKRLLSAKRKSSQCKFIYVSTNSVFSGKCGPYSERMKPDPDERHDQYRSYAISRANGEQVALSNWPNTIVVRTADVNGNDVQGKLNPRLINLLEQFQAAKPMDRLCNAYISPTLVDNLAAGLLEVSDEGFEYQGILHIAGSEQVSYYEFARLIARQIRADEQLVKADHSRQWNISLDTIYTQSLLKTRLLGVQEQISAIFKAEKSTHQQDAHDRSNFEQLTKAFEEGSDEQ